MEISAHAVQQRRPPHVNENMLENMRATRRTKLHPQSAAVCDVSDIITTKLLFFILFLGIKRSWIKGSRHFVFVNEMNNYIWFCLTLFKRLELSSFLYGLP